MKKKNIKKIVLIIILLFLAALILSIAIPMLTRYFREQTGEQWFAKQEGYYEELSEMFHSADDIFALYISGNMAQSDFVEYLSMLYEMSAVMENKYDQDLEKHPIRANTYTYYQKSGAAAIRQIPDDFQAFLTDIQENIDDMDYVIYGYAAFGEVVTNNIACYEAAKSLSEQEDQ